MNKDFSTLVHRYFIPVVGIAMLVGLFLTSRYNYLLFHSLAEIFSIVVAYGIFMIAWNSRKYIENDYLIFIAIAYLFLGGLDLLHTLSYKGMTLFPDYDYYANQLWIAARYMESLTLLTAFSYFYRKTRANPYLIFSVYAGVSAVLIMSIFTWKIFPVCFIEGQGLTPFKKISEYIICGILVADIWLLQKHRARFDSSVFHALVWSLLFTIISELAFTFYISNYGLSNLVGHYFKIFSFYLIYKAIIETGIVQPYDIIFRELVQKEHTLAEAKQAADLANQAKSEFLSNMSHELRTPLNGILGYTQILKRDERIAESQQEGLDIIERSGKHLLNLINEVLDLSKIEAQKMEIHPAPFAFPEFLRELAKMIEIRAHQKGLLFYIDLAPNLPATVQGDEQRLSQVLLNLLGNAVKFTEHGSISFRVLELNESHEPENSSTHQHTNLPTHHLRFEIEDTGVGIGKEHLEDIFSPFKQVGENSRKVEGTGLGLAISRKLVRLMGGELYVTSTVNQGSAFWFELLVSEAPEPAATARAETTQKIIGYAGKRRKLLVVDDRRENRLVLVDLLTPLGFEVIEAEDGLSGLKKAEETHPDLIFMDLVMPVMDGFEAIRKIRKISELKGSKIVAVSASTSQSEETIIRENTLDGFIAKPVHLSKVFDVLHTQLDLEWFYAPAAAASTSAFQSDNWTALKEAQESVMPPRAEIEALYTLACGGDILGIRERLDIIEQLDPSYAPCVRQLREFAKTFQIRSILEFTETYLEEYTS